MHRDDDVNEFGEVYGDYSEIRHTDLALEAKMVDWGWYKGILGRSKRVFPGDVDGLVEVNGLFLLIEWKYRKGLPESQGQARMLAALRRIPEFTVFEVMGDYSNPQQLTIYMHNRKTKTHPLSGKLALKQWMSNWAEWADRQ